MENYVPNSPFSIKPVTMLAIPENQENVSFLMEKMINTETAIWKITVWI